VRVANRGCETLHDARAKLAWANPAMIQTDWSQIDIEKGGGDLAPGEAKVIGPFDWMPTAAQTGHRCLLVIARSTEDSPSVAGSSRGPRATPADKAPSEAPVVLEPERRARAIPARRRERSPNFRVARGRSSVFI
jgi:hypothetical protein